MFCLLVYDVPSDIAGTKRRNAIYNMCLKHGYHVQNSVFEFDIDYGTMLKIERAIENIIDVSVDSVRVYSLGKKRTETNVKVIGKKERIESNNICVIL